MAVTLKFHSSWTNQRANKQRRQKKRVKISIFYLYLYKTQPGQETAGNFPIFFLKKSTRQMFQYPGLDAGLNTAWFLGVMGFPKPISHSVLNNGNSG